MINVQTIRLLVFVILAFMTGCSSNPEIVAEYSKPVKVVTEDYELIKPNIQKGFLVLFPCYPCDAENTRTEFNILDIALKNNITVLLMNFNQHLWLTDLDKEELEEIIKNVVQQNDINTNNTYLGGFSSGGNVSILMTDYLKSNNSTIQPKGLFIADSPVDLYALYENAQLTLKKNFSEIAMREARWIVSTNEGNFGVGDTALVHYESRSPYLSKVKSNKNISNLNGVNIRLYSEPDTTWWKENRLAEYEDMNAYFIEQLSLDLIGLYGKDKVEFIQTVNRGYRSNGDRHPHSWSIIDEEKLVEWILED